MLSSLLKESSLHLKELTETDQAGIKASSWLIILRGILHMQRMLLLLRE